ncbi:MULTISPECIES: hypothetical protein [unclassified Dyella]|jgi:hypothetical protein|uniref:hypothetical protein n=1 Tax=unclassified Dyella TaxID=2634549 RepID=UPI003F92B66E
MTAHGMLIAPWYAMRQTTRWIVLAISVLLAAGASAFALFGLHGAERVYWAPVTGMLVATGVFMLTLFGLSPCLLLAIDGRKMRLPCVEREASGAVLLYGVLLVIVPSVVIGSLGGYTWNVMAALAAAVTAGLAMALLPRVFSFFIWLLPAVFNMLQPVFHLPRPAEPGFPLLGGTIALVFALIALGCWRRVAHSDQPYGGMGAPMMMQFGAASRGGWGSWGGAGMDASTLIRRNPAWLQPRVELRQSGPAHPVTSLRIGLGGVFAPLTTGGRAMQLSIVLGASLIFVLQLGVQAVQRHPGHFSESFVHTGLVGMLMWGVGFGGSMIALLPIAQLVQRWMKQNAELPLLALMPGLGDAAHVKRRLLCASLLPPLAALGALMVLALVLATLLHASAIGTCALMLTLCGAMAFVSAFVVSVLGGRPLGRWPSIGLCLFGYVLFSVSIMVPLLSSGDQVHGYVTWFVGAWGVLLALLAWLALRGWRGLARRPHPFLANSV